MQMTPSELLKGALNMSKREKIEFLDSKSSWHISASAIG